MAEGGPPGTAAAAASVEPPPATGEPADPPPPEAAVEARAPVAEACPGLGPYERGTSAAAPAEPEEEETPGRVEVKVEPGTGEPPPAMKTHSATAAPMMMTDIAPKAKARGAPPAEGPPGDGGAGGAAAPPKKRRVLPQPLFETDITFFERRPAPPPWE